MASSSRHASSASRAKPSPTPRSTAVVPAHDGHHGRRLGKGQGLKGLTLEGPILLPVPEDLPFIARPYTTRELEIGERLAKEYGVALQRKKGPIQVIGTGPTINEATDNAIGRTARLLQMSQAEVRNRCTITGAVEIARLPGAVQLTILAPLSRLDELGLGKLVRRQYGLA